jgi:hypothetical protein
MSMIHVDGFDAYATAQLPALWTSASGVTINATSGRLGGGAAVFNAATPSVMTKTATWQNTAGGVALTTLGFAIKVTTMPSAAGATVAKLVTSVPRTYRLIVTASGALQAYQDAVQLGVSIPNVITVNQGAYVEWQVRLVAASPASVIVKVNGVTVISGAVVTVGGGEAFASVTLGGGTSETGQWLVDDFYVVDGHAESVIAAGSSTIDNAGFLGNVRVEALFATQDGFHIGTDGGYTPWTPNVGTEHFTRVREHPPDEDVTYDSTLVVGTYNAGTHHLNIYATYQFTHPLQSTKGFGVMSIPTAASPAPLYGVHWVGRLKNVPAVTVKATVRQIPNSTGLPSTDTVAVSASKTLTASYQYYDVFWDRDAISALSSGPAGWTFNTVFLRLAAPPDFGYFEFGVMRAT